MKKLALAAMALCASLQAAADTVEISEWLVPWKRSEPRDPYADARGRIWFAGERGDYIAYLTPETGEFSRYDLDGGTGPQGLVVGDDGIIWYAGNRERHIGRLNPATGRVAKIGMPERRAREPYRLRFDPAGDVWFTVHRGNYVGKLDTETLEVELIEIPGGKARPEGLAINSRGEPWAGASDDNRLLRIDPDRMSIAEVLLPDEDARPRRLAVTSDDRIWWTDYERGHLGVIDPQSGAVSEWPLPGGEGSRPLALAADRFDRLWTVETGPSPNRFVGFDSSTGEFFSITDIPSGGGTVYDVHYYQPAGEIWFGSESNYIGRAKVH